METTDTDSQQTVDQVYEYAASLLVNGGRSGAEVEQMLQNQGLDAESASIVVNNLQAQIKEVKNSQAKKDMLHGALWCVGGAVLTLAHIGFIFWGAIIFGGIQFIKGVTNLK